MKVKKIAITAGRTLSMPGTAYQNVRPQVTFEADLDKGEDHIEAAKALHIKAEEFMEDICDELRAYSAFREQKRRKQEAAALKEAS